MLGHVCNACSQKTSVRAVSESVISYIGMYEFLVNSVSVYCTESRYCWFLQLGSDVDVFVVCFVSA